MSWEASTYVLGIKVGSAARKLVLMGYANHAHKDGTAAFPGIPTIMDYAECSRSTAQRHVAALVDEGFMREGDQQLVAHYAENKRPIVYDVAMNEETRQEWAALNAMGGNTVREKAAAAGSKGGQKSKAQAAAKKAAEATGNGGVNLTPQEIASNPESGGVEMTPHVGGVNLDASGVSNDAVGGVTGDTQTTQATSLENHPSFAAVSAKAAETSTTPSAEVASPDGSAKEEKDPRGTRIPKDFTVTPHMVEWATREAPDVDGRVETQNFIDYWTAKSGQAARKTDWTLTWYVWFRNCQKRLNERRKDRGTSYRDQDVWGDERPTILTDDEANKAWGITPPATGEAQAG